MSFSTSQHLKIEMVWGRKRLPAPHAQVPKCIFYLTFIPKHLIYESHCGLRKQIANLMLGRIKTMKNATKKKAAPKKKAATKKKK
jgi:hypothetical protein